MSELLQSILVIGVCQSDRITDPVALACYVIVIHNTFISLLRKPSVYYSQCIYFLRQRYGLESLFISAARCRQHIDLHRTLCAGHSLFSLRNFHTLIIDTV